MMQAIREVDPQMAWEDVEGDLLPLFRRRRPYPRELPALHYLHRPPGVDVSVAIDIGPAFVHVDDALLGRWKRSAEETLERAVQNVRWRAANRPLEPIVYGEIGGVPTTWFQTGEGIGSGMILAPDLIAEHFGTEAQFVLAPMRDLLVAIPVEAGLEFATYLYESIAEEDPNCLDLPVLTLIGGRLDVAQPPPGAGRRLN
jgi:hypothetical protein